MNKIDKLIEQVMEGNGICLEQVNVNRLNMAITQLKDSMKICKNADSVLSKAYKTLENLEKEDVEFGSKMLSKMYDAQRAIMDLCDDILPSLQSDLETAKKSA